MLALTISVVIYNLLFAATTLLCVRLVGGHATAVQIGFGPKLRVQLRGLEVRLALLPISSYVSILGRAPGESEEDPRAWSRLSRARRVIATLGPWILLLGLGCAILGGLRGLQSFARAFGQLLFTWDVTSLVRGFGQLIEREPFLTTLGIVLCKITAFNLLPLPNLGGGSLLTELFGRPGRPFPSEKHAGIVTIIGMVASLSIAARFAWAIVTVARD